MVWSGRARVEDVHELAMAMAHVRVEPGSRGNPVYQVGGKSFIFFRNPCADATDPEGIMLLGTSMDHESQRSRDLGCWDGIEFCTPSIDAFAVPVGDDWVVSSEFVDAVLGAGLGDDVSSDERAFWHRTHQQNYTGDEGRQRLRLATINLRDRDGLHARLDGVHCPVLWLQGTADQVYSVANAQQEIEMFTSADAELRVVEGGQHFLSASNPDETNEAAASFVRTHSSASPTAASR